MRFHVRCLLVFIITVTMLVAGCASSAPTSQVQDPDNSKVTQGQPVTAAQPGTNATARADILKMTVYRATNDAMYLVPEVHEVARGEFTAKTAIELMLTAPKSKEVFSPVPAGTKLKKLTIKDHIAYVDFNDRIAKNNGGGSTSERLLVGAIVNTLTEFPEIEKVQILVDGKNIETLSGHMDISEPLSRSPEIIKK